MPKVPPTTAETMLWTEIDSINQLKQVTLILSVKIKTLNVQKRAKKHNSAEFCKSSIYY